jgi:LydA holin phage, holin superfamily III
MHESDPTQWPIMTWVIALTMALGGGLVNWLGNQRVKEGHFRIFELFGELFTSGFVGVGIFMLSDSLGQPLGVSAAFAGIGGHMATRFLFLAERVIESRLISASVDNDKKEVEVEKYNDFLDK